MLDVLLAQQLRAAGLAWEPKPGDRFVLPLPDMQDEVFILSNVIADVHRDHSTGRAELAGEQLLEPVAQLVVEHHLVGAGGGRGVAARGVVRRARSGDERDEGDQPEQCSCGAQWWGN